MSAEKTISANTNARRAAANSVNRKARRAAAKRKPRPKAPQTVQLELTIDELAFLRLMVTNINVNQAVGKRIAASLQEKVEEHIGPLPTE